MNLILNLIVNLVLKPKQIMNLILNLIVNQVLDQSQEKKLTKKKNLKQIQKPHQMNPLQIQNHLIHPRFNITSHTLFVINKNIFSFIINLQIKHFSMNKTELVKNFN